MEVCYAELCIYEVALVQTHRIFLTTSKRLILEQQKKSEKNQYPEKIFLSVQGQRLIFM